MNYVGRFAPSPSGPLHFGSLVAALASYLDARAHGGIWLVRIEDIDETRCKPAHTAEILRTLLTLGLQWDGEIEIQSKRLKTYELALHALRSRGLVYACACSRKEIADSAIAGLEALVYPGTCRDKQLAEDGRAMRIRTCREKIAFTDLLQGAIVQDVGSEIGDFVIKRRDGLFAYQLAVVADDAAQGVTHIVRGADLLDSTARQIHLQRLLDYPTPQYLHFPVAVDEMGQKLSKQTLAAPVSAPVNAAQGLLYSALRFLGQSMAHLQAPLANEELLAFAVKNWDRGRIPRSRTMPVVKRQ